MVPNSPDTFKSPAGSAVSEDEQDAVPASGDNRVSDVSDLILEAGREEASDI